MRLKRPEKKLKGRLADGREWTCTPRAPGRKDGWGVPMDRRQMVELSLTVAEGSS
jgi:hypothetical protein